MAEETGLYPTGIDSGRLSSLEDLLSAETWKLAVPECMSPSMKKENMTRTICLVIRDGLRRVRLLVMDRPRAIIMAADLCGRTIGVSPWNKTRALLRSIERKVWQDGLLQPMAMKFPAVFYLASPKLRRLVLLLPRVWRL